MPSSLPTTDTIDKAVNTFGIGTYDSQRDNDGDHGEDSERREPEGETLPQEGGPLDPFGPDRLLSYPQEYTSQGKHASALMPGDLDRPPTKRRPTDDTQESPVETVADSDLPDDADNPSAHSDYYDHMKMGAVEDMWAKEDDGAYVSQESKLPGVLKNEETMDDYLQSLGNYWSGYEVEDVSGAQGFPSTDFSENIDIDRSDNQDGGRILAMRTATDLQLVTELTQEFLDEFGNKNLTRRHVMAFLTDRGRPQYLASDIIRCLKHNHKLVIPDVLDTFPIAKTASDSTATENSYIKVASMRDRLIELQIESVLDTPVSVAFGRCAADLVHVMVLLERS
jgi:hypothetical protein